jgi:hypothetical protein
MTAKEKFPSIKLNTSIPAFILKDGETLFLFIKYYYEWLEQFGQVGFVSRRIQEYRDVDTIPTKFFGFLRNEFMKNIPAGTLVDERTLLKNIQSFYRSRGSEKSVKLLFRILFNQEIEVSYPGERMLRASAGHWVVEKSIKVTSANIFETADSFEVVRGGTSNAKGVINQAVCYYDGGVMVGELYLTGITGEFVLNETICDSSSNTFIGKLVSNGVITHPGYYTGSFGFLSSDKVLQDNYFFQEYSYVIESTKSLIEYQDAVGALVHPAGTLMFGNIKLVPDIDADFDLTASIDFSLTSDLTIDFSLDLITSLVDGAISGLLEFDIALQMYVYDQWRFSDHAGAGRVAVTSPNTSVAAFSGVPCIWYRNIPIARMGTRYILKGDANTQFVSELANGAIIYAWQYTNANNSFSDTVDIVSYSNVAMLSHIQGSNRVNYAYKYISGDSNLLSFLTIE